MKSKLLALSRDPFMRHAAVFFVGSMIVAVLNYLYHPILSRMLSIQNFGDTETIISLFAQVSILLGIFSQIIINNVAHSSDQREERSELHYAPESTIITELYTTAWLIIAPIAVLLFAFNKYISKIFQFQSAYSILVLILLIILSVFTTFQMATLQGSKKFGTASFVNSIQAGGKLLFAIIFILLGFGVPGAIMGLVIAQIVTIIYAYPKTKSLIKLGEFKKPKKYMLRKEFPFAILILMSTGLVTLIYTSDIIVVKHFFTPGEAGLYSGVSTIAKIVFFVTGAIAGVLLPSITRFKTFRENNLSLIKALLLNTVIGGVVLAIFSFFPTLIVKVMIGSRYELYANYLAPLSFMVFLVSYTNLFVSFFLALREYVLVAIAIIGLLVFSIGITFFHSSIASIITTYIVTSIVLLLILLTYYIYYCFKQYAK